jgi:hypothetical protein
MRTAEKKIEGAKVIDARTVDGFKNLALKLGISSPGDGCSNNSLSQGHYQFNLITRNRMQLEAAYRGSWIAGRVIDCRAQDMVKAGIQITTNDGAEKLQDFKVQMSRLEIWQTIRDTAAWGRLYGGAIGMLQIEGQALDSPLDTSTIEEGQFRGIAVYDRWQLFPVLSEIITEGPQIGLPKYYDIVLGSNLNNPGQVPGGGSMTQAPRVGDPAEGAAGETGLHEYTAQTANGPSASRVRIHHSRIFRMGGIKLPFFQAITEMMWDESILERLWDRLIEFETSVASAAGLITRANLRTIGIERFREILSAGGEAKEGLVEMFDYIRQFQSSEGLTLLDKEDNFQTTAYSFAGLSDILERFEEQISGACDTPLVRLFGQSPGGLNSSGESDMRNYYDSVNAEQEAKLRNPLELICKVLWPSSFGEPLPKDFSFTFTPLWQMTMKEKADIATANTTAIVQAEGSGLIGKATAMRELKNTGSETGLFLNITDEEIEEAENELPPEPEMEVNPATGQVSASKEEDPSKEKPKSNDSAWGRMKRMFGPAPKTIRAKTKDQKAIEQWLKKQM